MSDPHLLSGPGSDLSRDVHIASTADDDARILRILSIDDDRAVMAGVLARPYADAASGRAACADRQSLIVCLRGCPSADIDRIARLDAHPDDIGKALPGRAP